MILLWALAAIAALALLILWITALSNAALLVRLRPQRVVNPPSVSILVPARDEASVIGRTVTALLQQRDIPFELIILDDNSSDGTAQLARGAADGDPRLRIIDGQPLPDGWLGKNWACHQLAQAATGELLVFTDADVMWQPDALSALLAVRETSGADVLTVWPTQRTVTWPERLTVPLIALVTTAYLPLVGVHYLPWASFAAANGQCLAFGRNAYNATGGHAAVRDNIVEDVALARLAKRNGQLLRMIDGNHQISCRMYTGWYAVRDGFAKNIRDGHGSTPLLLLSTIMHLLVFVAPWVWLPLGFAGPGWPWAPLALITAGVGLRAFTAWLTHQRVRDAIFMPISALLMTDIALRSIRRRRQGQLMWKGRVVT